MQSALRVLLMLQCRTVLARADVRQQEFQKWVDNSTLIFKGTIVALVDPRNAKVYLVWGERVLDQPALHVICSDNGGTNWSPILHTVMNAINPGLAINTKGTVAFLYQELVTDPGGGETWCTQLELTKDDFKNVDPFTLAKFPASELDFGGGLPMVGQPRLGISFTFGDGK
jgi:hypothetical protein